jgi:serine/threonine-protein kinase PpkA
MPGEGRTVDVDQAHLPQIAGYTTESVLGAGGMATVYLAVQESLSRHVALKVMNQILMADADFCRRFLNEGRLIAKLSHPSIVTVYDIGASERYHYLSMTYLPGGTLREKIRRGLPLEYTLYIVKCLADALGYAHRQGIVHRDIKPSNVLFTHSGAPVLTDFGIAKTVGTETKLTSTGMTVGSVGYMSPEQALGNEVDNRADLYSLGVLFWQMLTGTLPYSAHDPFALALKHAHDPIPALPEPLGRFQPIIERLMAKNPDDRLASAEEMLRITERIPYDDIGSHSPPNPDDTIVLSRVPASAPNRRNILAGPEVAPQPAPKRRIGLVLVLVGLAGVVALLDYGGLLTTAPVTPADSPSALKDTARVTEIGVPSRTVDEGEKRPLQTAVRPPTAVPAGRVEQDIATSARSDTKSALTDGPERPRVGEQQDIDALLRKAESQWKAGRLTEPKGDNAFESYTRVLDLDPEHPQAREALVKIGRINAANRVFLSADALLRQGAIEDARRMIETGLRMNPEDERLLGLRQALDYAQ